MRREQPALLIVDVRRAQVEADSNVLQAVRLDRATQATPVIICSADAPYLAEHAAHLWRRGCQALAKPFAPENLLVLGALG